MKRTLVISAALSLAMMAAAHAQVSVKLGVLNDRSGIYSDLTGEGSVIAARMAVEDFKAAEKGIKVEIVAADHQNKPDVGAGIARQWYDQDGVDAILDVPTSSVALAVNTVTRDKNKVFINSGGGTSDLTGANARRTRFIGPMTPGRWRTAPAPPWSSVAAIPGSSSRRITPSVRRLNATPRRWSPKRAARLSAP